MNCIMNAFDLFKTNGCQAWTLAALAFVLGAVASCLVCKAACKCGRDGACGGRRRRQAAGPQRRQAPGQGDKPFEKRKPHPAPADGSVEIYVGNLSYEVTEDQLRKEFEAFGKVNSARLIMNKFNGKSKGFGFVNMPDRAEAERACAALDDKEFLGRRMKCNEAKNLV